MTHPGVNRSARSSTTLRARRRSPTTGADLKGEVGDKVPFSVKYTNAGPAWVAGEGGTSVAHIRVKMPAGTTVTKATGLCHKVAAGTYECGTGNYWVDEHSGNTYDFTLRVDKAVPGAKGSVSFDPKYPRPFDHVTSNDTAAILLDVPTTATTPPASSATTGGTTRTTTAGNAPAPDNQLAATGSGPALPLTAAAAAALTLGTAVVLTAYRRTSRRR